MCNFVRFIKRCLQKLRITKKCIRKYKARFCLQMQKVSKNEQRIAKESQKDKYSSKPSIKTTIKM